MQTQMISRMISNAVAHEQHSGTLATLLAQYAGARGAWPNTAEIAQTVGFIREYLEHVPALLEATAAAAQQVGAATAVLPILETAVQYFLSPLDLIPDHLGLVGLMDDAYLAHRLIQAISTNYLESTGNPLLPIDLAPANNFIRGLIGEPQASQLDSIVASTLKLPSIQRAFQELTPFSNSLPVEDPIWGSADLEGIVTARTEALDVAGSVSRGPSGSRSLTPDQPKRGCGAVEVSPRTWHDEAGEVFQKILNQYREKVQSDEVSKTRQQTLGPVLEQIEQLVKSKPDDVKEMISQVARVRELMGRLTVAIAEPSRTGSPVVSGSRAERLRELLRGVKTYIAAEAKHPMTDKEQETVQNLYLRCAEADTAIHELGADDSAAHALEHETLRQLGLDARAYARRNYLMLADPIWPSPPAPHDPNAVFFSGRQRLKEMLSRICAARSLKLQAGMRQRDYAQSRWDQLRASNVAVFDLAQERGPQLAGVCYELGMALSLGTSVVIAAMEGMDLPFDVDVEPIWLEGSDGDSERLAEAIDEALFSYQRGGGDSSISETIAYAKQRFAFDNRRVKQTLDLIDDETAKDPIKVRHLLESLLGSAGPEAPKLLYPAWPGSYPEPGTRRCFHVMPFREPWSHEVMQITEMACGRGIEYLRGDTVQDPRIIRSIWNEICRATHVVVDLTRFNPNVALELGMAHTLGRNTLIVGQGDETVRQLFPSIAKLRLQPYSMRDVGKTLRNILDRFLAPK